MTSPYYGALESWGHMDVEKIQDFLNWLRKNKLESTKLKASDLVVNLV